MMMIMGMSMLYTTIYSLIMSSPLILCFSSPVMELVHVFLLHSRQGVSNIRHVTNNTHYIISSDLSISVWKKLLYSVPLVGYSRVAVKVGKVVVLYMYIRAEKGSWAEGQEKDRGA